MFGQLTVKHICPSSFRVFDTLLIHGHSLGATVSAHSVPRMRGSGDSERDWVLAQIGRFACFYLFAPSYATQL